MSGWRTPIVRDACMIASDVLASPKHRFIERKDYLVSVRKIAIFALSALGELVLSVPLIVEVRRIYPGAQIILVVERKAVHSFAVEMKIADEVAMLPGRSRKSIVSILKNRSWLAGLGVDIALQTFTSHGSYGNLLIGATNAPVRCGFDDGRFARHLTHRVPIKEDKHHVTLNLDLLRRLGHVEIEDPDGRVLPVIERDSTRFPSGAARERFGRYALISAGSDPKMMFKRWDDDKWASLCRRLTVDGITPVFAGHISEHDGIAKIVSLAGSGVNLAGETNLSDLAALIMESSIVVGTDGMLLHVSAAMGKPCVGIFGPTHPDNVGPWRQKHLVARLDIPCSPCYGLHTVGKGIHCTTHECLKFLTVDAVYDRIQDALAQRPVFVVSG